MCFLLYLKLIGFANTVPEVVTCIALTLQGAVTVMGTVNKICVDAGMGVLAVVAVTPSPTAIYAA